jgi:ATP/maltotriose-dependent transcriptional regulator MalT
MDDDGVAVAFEETEATAFLDLLGDLDVATVSACPDCSARVLAAVALSDLLARSAPHPRAGELRDLSEDAPTLHIFLVEDDAVCRHRRWRDPLADEWRDVVGVQGPQVRR